MITFKVTDHHFTDAEAYIVFCTEKHLDTPLIKKLSDHCSPTLPALIEARKFTGAAGSQLITNGIAEQRPVYIVLVGIGSLAKGTTESLETLRRATGSALRALEQIKVSRALVYLPDHELFNVPTSRVAQEICSSFMIATYHFNQFITDASRRHERDYEIQLSAPELLHDEIRTGIERGERIGFAVNQARHWCDLPGSVLTPTTMAEHAERIARSHNLAYTIFDEQKIVAMGMGGLEAVSKGSAEECRLVIMEYHTEAPNAPTIALVGKGVTFDSGGLSIKPAARMDEMKDDMAGAAAVIATMEACAHLKPRINVIGIAPLAENMPSGTATRPGDVIQFYNGKTAEIKNTDAEGRLILADALSYAIKHYKLDAIINAATLTGSCAYALGPFFCGLMSQHEELAEKVRAAGQQSGDRTWPLPFHDDYKVAVRSSVADLCNIGDERYRAGAITAGFFLQNFVGTIPWVHLDIAGTSFNVPDIPYYRPGATGFGVRLFIELLTNWR